MKSKLTYTNFPKSHLKETKTFELEYGDSGDYYLTISDGEKSLNFKYCMSGGFESKYPKITKAISNLFDAFAEEIGIEN